MRGRQKGQTKRMSVIKDPIITPYEIQVEEDQYVLIDTEKNKPLGYTVFFAKFIHSACGIKYFLFTRIERMALRAYINMELS